LNVHFDVRCLQIPLHINFGGMSADAQLMLAAAGGRLEDVEELLAAGADANRQTSSGATPLYIAVRQGHAEVAELLLRYGACADSAMQDGSAPLFIAAWHGHLGAVRVLLHGCAQVNQTTGTGAAPLFAAAMSGYVEVVQELLCSRASVNQATGDDVTPLMAAAAAGHTRVVRGLLCRNADAGQIRDDGDTASSVALRHGHAGVIELLRSSLVSHCLAHIAAAAGLRQWAPLASRLDWSAVKAAERNVVVELAKTAMKFSTPRTSCSHTTDSSTASCSATDTRQKQNEKELADSPNAPAAKNDIPSTSSEEVPDPSARSASSEPPCAALLEVAPYLRIADEFVDVEPVVAHYCRVFAARLLLRAMKRGDGDPLLERALAAVLEQAEQSQSLVQSVPGGERLEGFLLAAIPRIEAECSHNDLSRGYIPDRIIMHFHRIDLLLDVLEWFHGRMPQEWVSVARYMRIRCRQLGNRSDISRIGTPANRSAEICNNR